MSASFFARLLKNEQAVNLQNNGVRNCTYLKCVSVQEVT